MFEDTAVSTYRSYLQKHYALQITGTVCSNLKHHFPTKSALLNEEQQVTKHYITNTTGTTTGSSKYVVMIYKNIIDRLILNNSFIHE